MRKEKGFATISDVAKNAGVSTATVSRVIAGTGYVKEATRAKVEKSITLLKFQPSLIAQSLRKQSSAVIGLIVTDIQNPFYPELVRGVEDEVQKRGYSLILCNSAEEPEREKSYLNYLASHRVDGLIICASGVVRRHRKIIENFAGNVVIVNVTKGDLKIPTVSSNDVEGGQLLGQHLAQCGYPQVLYIGHEREEGDGYPRFKGLQEAFGKTRSHYISSGEGLKAGADAVSIIVKKFNPPFAVVGHNDLTAIGAMYELIHRGFKVPEEIGVAGYDDIAMSQFVSPNLTTINQNQQRFGKEALSILDQLFAGTTRVKNISISPQLIQRSSTMTLKKKR